MLLLDPTSLSGSLADRHEGLRGKPLFLNKTKQRFMLASSMLRQAAGPPPTPAFQAGTLTIMEVCREVLGKPWSHQARERFCLLRSHRVRGLRSWEIEASRSIFVWLQAVTFLRPCVWETSYGPHDKQLPFWQLRVHYSFTDSSEFSQKGNISLS